MHEIINTYIQELPAMRFIGIKYGDEDRVNGSFAAKWQEWFENNRFQVLEPFLTDDFKSSYEDHNSQVGLMRWKEGEEFQYWIGMFLPKDTVAPAGFQYKDFADLDLGVCWLQGNIPDIYGQEEECARKLSEEGYEIIKDQKGAWWFFERYGCPRFTQPDENGKVILDICHFVK